MRVRSARSGERAGGSQALDRYCSGLLLLLVRSTPLRAGLRRKEIIFFVLYPALSPSARVAHLGYVLG
jgi:hypothetical protein